MNKEKLYLFIKLAELKHFHRAAETCHVSPSKLSRSIQAIEEELNVRLFERTNRSVELTAEGLHFLKFSREEIKRWQTLKDKLQEQQAELSGRVSIFCSVTASYSFLYDILDKFRRTHPLIQVTLHTGDSAQAIERVNLGHEDLAITALPDQLEPKLSFKQFSESPLVFIAAKKDKRFSSLIEEKGNKAWPEIPMILSEHGLARTRFDRWVAKKKFDPQIYSEVSGNEAIVSMVSLGFGIGLVPQIVIDNSPLKKRVSLFRVQPDIPAYKVGVCVQSSRLQSPIVSALWQLIPGLEQV